MSKNELVTMKSENDVFCSMVCETIEEKVQLYNAINNADASLDDMVGKQITVVNVYAERYTAEDEEENKDGFEPVEKEKIMITLICKDGKTYATNSKGVYNSIKRAFALFGVPTWKDGVTFAVCKVKTKGGYKATILRAV